MSKPRLPTQRQHRRIATLAAALPVALVFVVPLLAWRFHSGHMPIDLAVYREAGSSVLHGRSVYGADFGQNLRVALPFTYPPLAGLLSVPLAVVSAGVAAVAWTTCSLAALLFMADTAFAPLLDRFGRARPAALGVVTGALAWTTPASDTFSFGQVNLILAALCMADCLLVRSKRGILVGIATAVKLTPGLFIVYFLATRQWRAARRAALAVGASSAFAALFLPRASWKYWSSLVWDSSRVGGADYFSNQSLNGLLHHLTAPGWLWPPLVIVTLAIGMSIARRAHANGTETLAVGSVGLTTLLVSPVSWMHHGVWIVPVLGAIVSDARSWRRALIGGLALALFIPALPSLGDKALARGGTAFPGCLLENAFVSAYGLLIVVLGVLAARAPLREHAGPDPGP